jgi:hypothetical protein
MMGFNQQLLATLINDINPVDDHPIRFLLVDTDDFDVFLGNSLSQRQAGRHVRRRISQDEFDAARQRDEIIGRNGEKLVQTHFELSLKDHAIFCYKWVSCEDVTAPYDFELTNNNGETILLDVKSTGGSFAAPIHISIAQLLTMAQNDKRYDLYRVYELNEKRGKFRIAKNMHDYACSILEVFQTLPEGIQVETIILSPGMINFDGEQIVVLSEDGD